MVGQVLCGRSGCAWLFGLCTVDVGQVVCMVSQQCTVDQVVCGQSGCLMYQHALLYPYAASTPVPNSGDESGSDAKRLKLVETCSESV